MPPGQCDTAASVFRLKTSAVLRSCQAKRKAVSLAAKIKREKGVRNGVASFYEHLPQDFLEEKRQQQAGRPKLPAQVCLLASSPCLSSILLQQSA